MKRHQDYIYEQEDYYRNPKETFAFLKELISNSFSSGSVLDIGCARGEFLYYLKQNFNYTRLFGVDYSENLINYAKNFKGLSGDDIGFHACSAEELDLNTKFDIITMSGVLSYFDSTDLIFEKMRNHLTNSGRIYILDGFNEYDIDVIVRYRHNKISDKFESGWNFHSIDSLGRSLKRLSMYIVDIHKFNLSFKLCRQEDAARSWHIDTEDGRRLTNGLSMLYDLKVIEIGNSL